MTADEQAEQAKDVIRRFVEEVQNQKNWDVYDELNDPGFVNHSAPPGMADREGSKHQLAAFLGGFPDGRFCAICSRFAQLYFVYFLRLHIFEHWIFEKSMVESKRHGADLQKRTGILGSAVHLDRGADGGRYASVLES